MKYIKSYQLFEYNNPYNAGYSRAKILSTDLLFKKVLNWTVDVSPLTDNGNEEFRAYMETLCQRKDLTEQQKKDLYQMITQGAEGVSDVVNNYYLRLLNYEIPQKKNEPIKKELWTNATNVGESLSDNDALINLYNGIMNDHSIQRYSMGWKDVTKEIKKLLKTIPKSDIQFQDSLVYDALKAATGKLKKDIEVFGRELGFSRDTLRDKDKTPQKR